MKKILILGTSNVQMDLIKECKKMGFYIFACSNRPIDKDQAFVDEFELIDITKKTDVLDFVKKKGIDLIYSVGSDVAMPTVTFVSNRLNLPCFIDEKTTTICNRKDRMREFFGADFTGNINYTLIDKDCTQVPLKFPFIIKPVDSQGQRGVFLINNEEDFFRRVSESLNFSKTGRLIAEDYLEGDEISVNVYIVEGDIRFFLISDRISWKNYPGGIIHKHLFPSNYEGNQKVSGIVQTAVNRLGIQNGPVYFQIKFHRNAPKLLEVTPRFDGCHIWRVIEKLTGINLLRCTVNHLLGEAPDLKPHHKPLKKYTLEFFCDRPERIMNKHNFKIQDNTHTEWYYHDGERIRTLNGHFEKVGYCITSHTI